MPDLPAINYKGKLKKIDEKVIEVDLDDGRMATFERSRKTKFYKDSKEVKASVLQIGDRVSIEATEDPQAYLDALKVTFDNSPPVASTSTHDGTPTADDQKASVSESAQITPPKIQYDDSGRPTLKRRIGSEGTGVATPQSDSESHTSDQIPELPAPGRPLPTTAQAPGSNAGNGTVNGDRGIGTQQANNAAPPLPSSGRRMDSARTQDPLVEKARALTASASSELPNFTCQEVMARSSRDSNETNWQAIDVLSGEMVYEGGKQSYRNLKINDQPAEDQSDAQVVSAMSASWSVERLISALTELFSPDTAAQFQFGGQTDLPNMQARVYDFDVTKENSQWLMRMGSETIHAAYNGSVWLDKESGRVLRLEMLARQLPEAFPVEKVETDIEYSFLRLGESSAEVPVHVETMGCQRETHLCSRTVVDYRNCQRESSVK